MSRKPIFGWSVWMGEAERELLGRRVEVRDGEHVYVRRAPRARSARVALAEFLLDTDYSDATGRLVITCTIVAADGRVVDEADITIGAGGVIEAAR